MKPRFNRTSRRKKQLPKVDARWLGDGSRQFVYGVYLGVALAPAATWNLHTTQPKYLMTHKYRGSQQSSREVKPKFIDSTQGEPKNIYNP
jgi:hypothetical protein